MNILVINQPLNNRGDESAHKALIRTLNKINPHYKITILSAGSNPDSIKQFNVNLPNVEYVNLPIYKGWKKAAIVGLKYNMPFLWKIHPTLSQIINIYRQNDYVICAPGGICMGGFQNWIHLFFLKIAQYTHRPLIYYGRSFGPFPTTTSDNKKFKKISLEMLNYFSFLSIRDKKTEELAQKLNLTYTQTIDTAFLETPNAAIPNSIVNKIGNSNYVVFVPNLLIWHYAYKNRISKETVLSFYSQIIDIIFKKYPDHKIIMLPQTFNYGTYDGDDIHLFHEIEQLKKDNRIIVIEDKYSSDIQQAIIAKSKFLIGARYHSVVFAINNNTPFIALSYEHKISGLLATLDKENCMIDIIHALDNEENIKKTIQSINNMITSISKDESAREKAKELAQKCFNIMYKNFLPQIRN